MTLSTQWYLDSIELELADLPADERAELLEDLATHFSEFESEDDLVSTLGDPAAYARELRDAAGLTVTPLLDTHVALVDRARANIAAVRRSAWWRAVAGFLPELRPAWWVLRAWLIVAAIAEGPPGSGGLDFPFPRVADNALVGLAALMIVVPVSVMLGLRARRGQHKGLNVALTLFGALFFAVLPASADNDPRQSTWINSVATTTSPSPVTTVKSGQAGTDALWLYDDAGNGYRVTRVRSTPEGRIEIQALCPIGVMNGTTHATLLRPDGSAIVCIAPLTAGASPPLASSASTAPTTAPPSTTVPTTTVTVATTAAPSTIPEATR